MPSPTASRGQETTSANSGLIIRDVSPEIVKLSARQATLTTLTMMANRVTRKQREYSIPIQTQPPDQIQVATLAGGLTITVSAADAPWIEARMQLRKSVSQIYRVVSIDYATNIVTLDTVAGLANGDYLLRGNAASIENSLAPTPLTRLPATVSNYCETARWGYGLSRFAKTTMYYGGAREVENRQDALQRVKLDIERGLWANKAYKPDNGDLFYKTSGVIELGYAYGNVIDTGNGVISLQKLRQAMTTACRFFPSAEPLLFVSRQGAELIDLMKIEKVQPHDPAQFSELGLSPDLLRLGNKKVKLYEVDHLNTPDLAATMAIMDPKGLRVATTVDAKTGKQQWMLEETDARLPGQDGDLGVITCDFGGDFVPPWVWLLTGCRDYTI